MQRRAETETHLWCSACMVMHDKLQFTKASASPSGFDYSCKSIIVLRNRRSHLQRRDEINARHVTARLARKESPEHRTWALKRMLADARLRASKRNIEFSLLLSDLQPPDTCPVFSVPLDYQVKGSRTANSASLDRIDSARGYTLGNVWIISWRANRIKSDATVDELRQLLEALDARAGRLLDGIEHNGFPEVKP